MRSPTLIVLLGLLIVPLTAPSGLSAGPIDLSTWTALTLDMPGGQPPGNWVLSGANTVATQTINADPSFFLNNLDQANYVMEGSWRVITTSDDDFMGFAFGYQDPAHTYIFDWKQADQNEVPPYGGLAREGFSIKKIAAPDVASLTHRDFWVSQNTANTTILATHYGNYGWQDLTSYDFRLVFSPGSFRVTVMQGATVLWDVTVNDATYPSGQFGFYNYSQQNVEYSGFEQTPLFAFDIHPTSCPNPYNPKKKGVTPVAILGSADSDVAMIDPATLLLEGVAPLRWSYDDVATPATGGDDCPCTTEGPDGFTDLTLKFSTPELVDAIGPVIPGEVLSLTIVGQLLDGTPIEAVDCMIVRGGPIDAPEPAPGIEEEESYPVAEDSGGFEINSDSLPRDPHKYITYSLPRQAEVTLAVYDVAGRLVDRLVYSVESQGVHSVKWNASGQPNGVYFYRLEADGQVVTKKVMLIR